MKKIRLALAGNPNSGKSSLFNTLTGLHQKTGNFAGVTVEKVTGTFKLGDFNIEVTDLPGTYSLHPLTEDEHVVLKSLLAGDISTQLGAILYVADATQLERHLLLFTQIKDLGYPVFLALSMAEIAEKKSIDLNLDELEKHIGQRPVLYNVRNPKSVKNLKKEFALFLEKENPVIPIYHLDQKEENIVKDLHVDSTPYGKLLYIHHGLDFLEKGPLLEKIEQVRNNSDYEGLHWQVEETLVRYQKIEKWLHKSDLKLMNYIDSPSYKADRWLTHGVLGPLFFLFVMFLVFQAIFSLAEWPMNGIDWLFSSTSSLLSSVLPAHRLSGLITEGIIPGIAGVVIFIPQIALLFFLIAILEESGYMSRAVYLFDRFFQRFGLNGRSLVALVSASACAIPAVMSTRSIKNKTERLITIMISPLMSCSARTPVYIVLIAFIVSSDKIWGWVNPQGLVFVGFYLVGLFSALGLAWVLKVIFKSDSSSYLMLELPEYKWPNFRSIIMYTWHKVSSFVYHAGKIIFLISIILWFLASYGPGDQDEFSQKQWTEVNQNEDMTEEQKSAFVQSKALENSYAGRLGKVIEPAIAPLGFDWKIGIALITSFAAREVFVSTMATIYSVGSEDDYIGIQAQMRNERRPDTLEPVYTKATALSLVVFYIFAMQCMSTLAVVRKETGTWKWPIVQFVLMGVLAYAGSFLVYNLV